MGLDRHAESEALDTRQAVTSSRWHHAQHVGEAVLTTLRGCAGDVAGVVALHVAEHELVQGVQALANTCLHSGRHVRVASELPSDLGGEGVTRVKK